MRTRITALLLTMLAFGFTLDLPGQDKSTPKPKGPVDETPIKELPPGKVISRQDLGQNTTLAQLANGMVVIVCEHHVAPVATARCYVRNTGSAYEGKHLGAGISHLTEHLVSGGSTKNRNDKEIEDLVNSMGANSNAYTSTDVTNYYLDTPAKHVDKAIDILADAMQNCIFPEKEFAREYHVVQRELEMGEEERDRVLWHMLSKLMYQEHPLRHPVIGYLPVLQSLKREDVIQFYKERYQPQNMVFVVVGDVKTEPIIEEISKRFNTFKRTSELTPHMPVEPPLTSPRRLSRQMEGELSTVSVAWPTVGLQHPDLYALDVASFILGSGDSSRLTRKLRFKENLVTSIGSTSYTPPGPPGWFQVEFEADPKNVAKAQPEAIAEVYRLKHEPVSDAELAKAKKQVVAAYVFGHQSVEQIAESLSSSYRSTGDPLFDSFYAQRIQKVTADDIQRVARTYLLPDKLVVAVIDPLGTKTTAAGSQNQTEEGKVQKHKLPNGITVLLKRSTAAPLVHLQCIAKAGTMGETDANNGVAGLTADLMTRGTEKHSGDAIADYFDAVGGGIEAASGRNTNYVTCTVLKEDFEKALDYFTQVCLHPTFPKEEFEDRKNERLLDIGQRAANTFAEASEFFHDTMPAGASLRRISGGRKDSVSKLTAEDCRRFHATYFVPQNLTVTVFGDVDPAKALALVQDKFGSLKPGTEFKFPALTGLSLSKSIEAHKTTQKPDTAVIILAFPTTDLTQAKENAAVLVLQTILSGYDAGSGWLFRDLRGAGLVYVVQASHSPGLATGYFSVVAQTRPDQLPEAIKRIKDNLAKAGRGEISQDEFDKAVQNILNARARENETIGERARQAGFDEALGLGHDHEDKFEERLKAVRLDDVKAAAKRYFTNSILVTTGPAGGK